jgi:gamma-glutamylcyclotransferase (GGCT)/AIG2-like uncharacterized protein YtfP
MYLFVYGTLKRGDCRHHFLAGQTFLAMVRTRPAYRMFKVGEFPGLVRAADGRSIEGELWDVDDACVAELDREEGFDIQLFLREPVELLPPHDSVKAVTYVYQREVHGMQDCGTCW